MTSSIEQENFYRHSTVIVDHVKNSFTNLLEFYLEQQEPAGITLRQFILDNRHIIYHLFDTRNACCLCPPGSKGYMRGVKPLLFRSQMEIMFESNPAIPSTAACNKFCCAPVKRSLRLNHLDVTLASILLLECTDIVPRGKATGRALESLRGIRNEYLGHAKEGRLSSEEYQSSMDEIERNLMVLAKVYGGETEIQRTMDEVRNKPFSEELYKEMLDKFRQLHSQMNEISEQVKENLAESKKSQEERDKIIAHPYQTAISVDPEPEPIKVDVFLGNAIQELMGTREEGEVFERWKQLVAFIIYFKNTKKDSITGNQKEDTGETRRVVNIVKKSCLLKTCHLEKRDAEFKQIMIAIIELTEGGFYFSETHGSLFDRGNGNIVTWCFKGTIRGIQWKYRGTCVDKTTGISCSAIKNSRKGSIEHALKALFQQLNITDLKMPGRFR